MKQVVIRRAEKGFVVEADDGRIAFVSGLGLVAKRVEDFFSEQEFQEKAEEETIGFNKGDDPSKDGGGSEVLG